MHGNIWLVSITSSGLVASPSPLDTVIKVVSKEGKVQDSPAFV